MRSFFIYSTKKGITECLLNNFFKFRFVFFVLSFKRCFFIQVKKFRSFGGNNFSDHTRRIMRHLFTDEFAEKYNWSGNGGKKKFSSLLICRLIIGE